MDRRRELAAALALIGADPVNSSDRHQTVILVLDASAMIAFLRDSPAPIGGVNVDSQCHAHILRTSAVPWEEHVP